MEFELVKQVNAFFKAAAKDDVERIRSCILLSDRQNVIFDDYYIHKKSVGYIADKLCVCQQVIIKELREIRNKLKPFLIYITKI